MASIKSEAERCLKCKIPMCAKNCPVGTPIPQVTQLFLEGKIHEAGELLFNNNPLTAVTSIICPHERNCAGHCVMGKKSAPVEFYRIEEYISRFYLETMVVPEIKKNGKRVAVVGSGPAGITMSLILAKNGYEVTLFEALDEIGGILRYGIPDFRLPRDLLDMYKRVLVEMGVKIRPNARVGTQISFDDLFMDGYKAIFLSIGTGRPNRLGLLGETLGHVHFAIDYLKSPGSYVIGKNVCVVGAGNVAIDAARTAIRRNRSDVTILHFMGENDMTANKAEIEMAEIDGVHFMHNTQAVRITDEAVKCVRVKREESEDGKLTFTEDYTDTYDVPADTVILAIGQGPGADLKCGDLKVNQRGLFEINELGETTTPGIFAAGDIVTGPRTVVEAVAFTRKVAVRMMEYIEKNDN